MVIKGQVTERDVKGADETSNTDCPFARSLNRVLREASGNKNIGVLVGVTDVAIYDKRQGEGYPMGRRLADDVDIRVRVKGFNEFGTPGVVNQLRSGELKFPFNYSVTL